MSGFLPSLSSGLGGVPMLPGTEGDCPCASVGSGAKRDVLKWAMETYDTIFNNPVADQVDSSSDGFDSALVKATSALAQINALPPGPGGPIATEQLQRTITSITAVKDSLSNYKNTSNQFSGLPFDGGGPDIMQIVSTVGSAVNLQCALGIPGLDISAGISLIQEDGQTQLDTAYNVQLDLNRILDEFLGSEFGTNLYNTFYSALSNIVGFLDLIAGALNTLIDLANDLINDAIAFVSQFANVSQLFNFGSDPCSSFGAGFKQQILNPEFLGRVAAANPLSLVNPPGFGSVLR